MTLVVGIDSSTQATKVEMRDVETGARVAAGRAPHPITTPPRSEQHPDAWWDALVDAFGQLGERRREVAAVGVGAQQHGLVVVDRADRVIRPAKLWNDTESAAEAASLVERLGPAAWAAACGSVPVAAFTISKLAWLAAHEPDAFERIARILLPHDWLTWRLTGEHVTDRGDASGTGWWSAAEERYRSDLLELIDVRDCTALLPRVLGPTDRAGEIPPPVAAELGLPVGVVVSAGTGDNMAAALGLGLRTAEAVVSLGTSGTVYARSAQPTADPTGAVAGFADARGGYLPLVCTLNATKVTDAIGRLLGLGHEELDRLALGAPAGAGGVVVVPYLDGERTPNLPDAAGGIVGLRSDVSRAQLARAAYEGVVCGLLDGLDALIGAGVAIGERLLVVGGGARSATYRKALADLSRRAVMAPSVEESAAVGAAAQAATALTGDGHDELTERWGLRDGVCTEPDPAVPAEEIRARYSLGASTVCRVVRPDDRPPGVRRSRC